jgi:hypothetical protein
MRSYLAVYLGVTLLLAAGCAGRSRDKGTAPFDSVHIRSGDTLPPANPDTGRAQPDTSKTDSTRSSHRST